jgi:NhaA family Na+:H+ antiporter
LDGNHDHGAAAHAPLFEFSHAIKPFTDLFILFFFGLCNAGVDTSNGVGPFAWVIVIALIAGKLLGIGLTAIIFHKCGFEFPKGMKIKHVIMVALIAGCGLTVSLFVAGQAFQDLEVQGQAKLGSLFSLAAAAFAIILSKFFDFTDTAEIPVEEAGKCCILFRCTLFCLRVCFL